MGQLKHLKIEGWKSIRSAELELRPINVLIGANGSGKSNLVSFFRMLNEAWGHRLEAYSRMAGGANSLLHFGAKRTTTLTGELHFSVDSQDYVITAELAFADPDSLTLVKQTIHRKSNGQWLLDHTARSDRGSIPSTETYWQGLGEPALLFAEKLTSIAGQVRVYHFDDTSRTARARATSYVSDHQWLRTEAENLASMLFLYRQKNPHEFEQIESMIHGFAPLFHRFSIEPDRLNAEGVLLNWYGSDPNYLFGPHQLSDGTLRAIALCTLFLQPEEDLPSVIVVDEPELGLHPQALSLLAGMVQSVSHRSQVILATQSSELVSFFEPEDVVVVDSENDETTFRRLNRDELADWLAEYSLGELWRKNVLGGGPLS